MAATAKPKLGLRQYLGSANLVGSAMGCATLVVVALYPLTKDDLAPPLTRQFLFIAMFAIVAVGLNLALGYAGEFAIGQAGLFAVGAYVAAMLTTNSGWSFWAALPAAMLGAAIVGVLVGLPGLRLGGWYFALTSLFIAVVIPDIARLIPGSGGFFGFGGIPYPTINGEELSLSEIYLVLVVALVLVLLFMFNLIRSGWGLAFLTMGQRSAAAEALGISVVRMKLIAYLLAAVCAGFAGAFFPTVQGYISPDAFPLSLSIMFVAAVVIGGLGSLIGSVVGVALMQMLPNLGSDFEKYALLIYGVLLIAAMYLIPDGAVPTLRKLWIAATVRVGRWRKIIDEERSVSTSVTLERERTIPAATLERLVQRRPELTALVVDGASKQFGGVHALRDASLVALPGEITAVIGPNGSGKTTLLNVILGFYRVDSGTVRLGDRSMTRRAPWRIARAGIGRTFQTPAAIPTRTALENVSVGMFSHRRATLLEYLLRLPRARHDDRDARAMALDLLRFVGLQDVADVEAEALSPGQQRLLEIARALAHSPSVLLLDEPAAGLVGEEIDNLAAVLRDLAALPLAVVLVEHNVKLVTTVADHMVVLDRGSVIATGRPDEVMRDPAVVASYLGTPADA